jgi:hypothetical protein
LTRREYASEYTHLAMRYFSVPKILVLISLFKKDKTNDYFYSELDPDNSDSLSSVTEF